MSRPASQRVTDILEAVDRCQRYLRVLKGSQDEDLTAMAEDAIERNLQVIGEAASRLPSETTERHPGVPWAQIRGFRNILVHQYFGVDTAIVQDVVETHPPPLVEALHDESH